MKIYFFFAVLLSVYSARCQTSVEKTIVGAHIDFIEIDATNCFDIILETSTAPEMHIVARIDGEYHKDLGLKVKEQGNTLQLGAGFQPNFNKPNDKLSAHKVISIALKIRLPEGKSVVLNGTSCNVSAKGAYRNLEVSLNDGFCFLQQISENVTVRTQSGDIIIESNTATIKAESKYGKVGKNKIPKGDNRYVLKTITGNIRFSKTE